MSLRGASLWILGAVLACGCGGSQGAGDPIVIVGTGDAGTDGAGGTLESLASEDSVLAAEIPILPEVEEFPLEDANRALVELKQRKIRGAKVLIPNG